MKLNGSKIRDFYKLSTTIDSDEETALTFRVPHFQRPFKWGVKEI